MSENRLMRAAPSHPHAAGPNFPVPATSLERTRLHAVDALRGMAIVFIVTSHAAFAYTRLDIPHLAWCVRDPSPHFGFDWLCWGLMGVSVPLFFTISGFLSAEIYQRRGPVGFLKNRAARIVGPFVGGLVIVGPLIFYTWSYGWLVTGRCTLREILRIRFRDPVIESELLGPGHLWFLLYLMPMIAAYWAVRRYNLRLPASLVPTLRVGMPSSTLRVPGTTANEEDAERQRRHSHAERGNELLEPAPFRNHEPIRPPSLGRWIDAIWLPLALAIPSALILWTSREFSGIDAALDRHNSFLWNPLRLLHYGLFFALGATMRHLRPDLQRLSARGWMYLIAAIPVFALRANLVQQDFSGGLTGASAVVLAAMGGLLSWLTTLGLIGVYRSVVDRPIALFRYLADSSYWIYLTHMPVLGLIQADLYRVGWPRSMKFAVVLATTLAIGLSSYEVFVRRTFLGRLLSGSKRPAIAAMSEEKAIAA